MVQGLNIGTTIFLARRLQVEQFGAYTIIAFIASLLSILSVGGFAVNLIRQREHPSSAEIGMTSSMQLLFAVCVSCILLLLSRPFELLYDLTGDGLAILLVLSLSLLFASLQTTPVALLERELRFDKLAAIDVSQAIVLNASLIYFTMISAGIIGFALPFLFRSIIGAIISNMTQRNSISLTIDFRRMREAFVFALQFQGSNFISFFKDAITPLFIGAMLGKIEVGGIAWAQTVAAYPVMLIMVMQRIYMPTFARLMHDAGGLSLFFSKTVYITNSFVAPLAIISLVYIKEIENFVFAGKWDNYLPLFYLFWVANLFVATSTPCIALLNSIGRSDMVLRFSLIWMLGTWIFGLPLIILFGAVGFGVANVIVQFSNLFLFQEVRKHLSSGFLNSILGAWTLSLVTVLPLSLIIHYFFVPESHIDFYVQIVVLILSSIIASAVQYKVRSSFGLKESV